MLGNVVTDAGSIVLRSAVNLTTNPLDYLKSWAQSDQEFTNVTVPNWLSDQIMNVQPVSSVITTKGEHVVAPTQEQLNQYYSDPNSLVNQINQTSWANYVQSIQNNIQDNSNTTSSNTNDFSILPNFNDLLVLVGVGIAAILGLNLITR